MAKKIPLFKLAPTKEQIEEGIEEYFEEHGGSGEDPLLAQHIADPTPHPAYDDLANGRFLAKLQNGMA